MVEETNNTAAQQQNSASTPTQTGAANPGSTEAKFTQADVERLINERIERAEKRDARVKADLLKQLGLADDANFDELKSTIEETRKRKLDEMTDAQKAAAERDTVIKERDTLKAQLEQQAAMIRERDIQGAVKAAVTTMKANDFDAIYLWAEKYHKDALRAVIDDEGKADPKALEKLLEAIKKDKPGYFTANSGQYRGSQSNADGFTKPEGKLPDTDIQRWRRGIKM